MNLKLNFFMKLSIQLYRLGMYRWSLEALKCLRFGSFELRDDYLGTISKIPDVVHFPSYYGNQLHGLYKI